MSFRKKVYYKSKVVKKKAKIGCIYQNIFSSALSKFQVNESLETILESAFNLQYYCTSGIYTKQLR